MAPAPTGQSEGSDGPENVRAGSIDSGHLLLVGAGPGLDMGPGGGPEGGRILPAGTPGDVARDAGSVTGPWLGEYPSLPGFSR